MSIFSANFRCPAPSGPSDGARKPWIVPIPGTMKLHRLEENLGAVNVELTPNDLREIEEAASEIDVQGARNPEKLEAMTGREVVVRLRARAPRMVRDYGLGAGAAVALSPLPSCFARAASDCALP
jgi:hypothetical protein